MVDKTIVNLFAKELAATGKLSIREQRDLVNALDRLIAELKSSTSESTRVVQQIFTQQTVEAVKAGAGLSSTYDGVTLTIDIGAGAGLTLGADSLALTLPGDITSTSTNTASGNHTHKADTSLARSAVTVTGTGALGGGGALTGNQTITMNTPGTLTASTSNSSATNHLHAITTGAASTISASTSNAAGSSASLARADHLHTVTASADGGTDKGYLLKSDVDGFLTLAKLTTPTLTAAANLTISPAGDVVLDPTGNDVYPSTGYDLNLGLITNKFLTLHAAELWVDTLVAQKKIATIGGRILVTKTTQLTRDLGSAAGNTTIYVKHNSLSSGEFMILEAGTKFECIKINSTATKVSDPDDDGEGEYSYTVLRDRDGTGLNLWYAGDALASVGGAAGEGFIDLYSVRGLRDEKTGTTTEFGPTIVGNIRNSTTWNDWGPGWAIGNLNGLYGYSSTEYGVGFGKYATGLANITMDATNGLRLRSYTTNILSISNSDGKGYISGPLYLDTAGGIYQGTGTFASPTTGIKIWNDGSGAGYVGAYNSGVAAVKLSGSGLGIYAPPTYGYPNSIRWLDGSYATERMEIYCISSSPGSFNTGFMRVYSGGAATSQKLNISCEGGISGGDSELSLSAFTDGIMPADYAGKCVGLSLKSKNTAGYGRAIFEYGDVYIDTGGLTFGADLSGATAGCITFGSGGWAGLGAAEGRITFTDDTTDTICLLTANVGVGTSSPSGPLDVESSSSATLAYFNKTGAGAQAPAIVLQSNGTTGLRLVHTSSFADGILDHNYASATHLILAVRGSSKVWVDYNGNVGVGAAPTYALDVQADTNNAGRIGRAAIGNWKTLGGSTDDVAVFGHVDHAGTAAAYALVQVANGGTILNAANGQSVYIGSNGTTNITLTSSTLGFFGGSAASKSTVSDPAAITATGTADATYSANEVTLINALKADVGNLRTTLLAVCDALQSYGLI